MSWTVGREPWGEPCEKKYLAGSIGKKWLLRELVTTMCHVGCTLGLTRANGGVWEGKTARAQLLGAAVQKGGLSQPQKRKAREDLQELWEEVTEEKKIFGEQKKKKKMEQFYQKKTIETKGKKLNLKEKTNWCLI